MPPHSDFRPSVAHAALGDAFFDPVDAARFPQHVLRHRDQRWAARVGLDGLSDEEWLAHFGGFAPLPGSFEQPLALRYHGHQFRSYNPDLGDGRGFLFAQMHDLLDGRLLDLGTKGSGTTPWSRSGDGRLTLKGGVREVLATSMLEALGVNTSKSLSLVETGEELYRGDEPSPTRASVLVRLSHSHIRIGTFQRLAYLGETELTLKLIDHAIRNYMPELWHDDMTLRVAGFLTEVSVRVARLGGQWMAAGFVHGVLNTDNINITGESFDYGPWRFLPTYQPKFTAAYFDHSGLYAFGRQPDTLLWNLARLGGCLLPLVEKPALEGALASYWDNFHRGFAGAIIRRLGLRTQGDEADGDLGRALYVFLQETQAPYEQCFFDLYGGRARADRWKLSPSAAFYDAPAFAEVRAMLSLYQPAASAQPGHAYFAAATPCTMLVDDVEALWAPIAERDDWSHFHVKLDAIATMAQAYGTTPFPPPDRTTPA